jgi:hypothetical protein
MPGQSTGGGEFVMIWLLAIFVVATLLLAFRRPQPARQGGGQDAATQILEARLAALPQAREYQAIVERVALVERLCDVLRAEIVGVKEGVARTEAGVNRLMQHQLDKEDRA